MTQSARPPKCGFLFATALACIAFAVPAKAQLTLNVFTDPHRTVSGGSTGFAFAGDKFVGSVAGDGVGILYSTDLNGRNTQLFAPSVSIPGPSIYGEHPLTASLGLGGFPMHDIYVSAGNGVLHITHDGTKSDMFCSGLDSPVRGMLFDGIGTFGYRLLLATYGGNLYSVDRAGKTRLVIRIGEDVEGMDIAPLGAGFGPFDGQLIVTGSVTGLLKAIQPDGTITTVNPNNPIDTPERLSFVPMNLGASGSALEGLYSANYPWNVLKADGSEFIAFKGDAIVMTEESDHRISRVHWNGTAFEITVIGASTGQAEDGFFLSPAMLNPGGSCLPREDTGERKENEWCWPNCTKGPLGHPKAHTLEREERGAPTATRRRGGDGFGLRERN